MSFTYLKMSDACDFYDFDESRYCNLIEYIKSRCSVDKDDVGAPYYYIPVNRLLPKDRWANVAALTKMGLTEVEALQYRWRLRFTDDSILVTEFVGSNPLRASEIARKFRCRLAVEERFTSSNRIHTYDVERGGRVTNLRIFEHAQGRPTEIVMEFSPTHNHKPRDLTSGSEDMLVWANPFLKKTA